MTRRTLIGSFALVAANGLSAASHGEKSARDQITELGGLVLEIAQNDDRLDVSFRGVKDLSDDKPAMLGELPKTVYLRLGGTGISDAALKHVAKLPVLIRLNLENNPDITDAGLAQLEGLDKLEYLNLFATGIGDEGLQRVAGLKALRRLYVWQTKVTDAGVAKLQEALPDLEIDRGWELPAQTKPVDDTSKKEQP